MNKSSKTTFFSFSKFYKVLFGSLLLQDGGIDAEDLTNAALLALGQASLLRNSPFVSKVIENMGNELNVEDKKLEQLLFGCNFKNPVGLAAGFDKNGVAAGLWHHFGFGFAELGTVTWHAQPGNPRPRLFRLSNEQAALNRMGFNNKGAEIMRKTLKRQHLPPPGQRDAILGINLGKSRKTSLDLAADDYACSLERLAPLADYAVINVSSPNTPNLRDLQSPKQLRKLIEKLRKVPNCPPLLVKIAPDLQDKDIDNLAKLAYQERIAGLIAVNTSLNRLGLEERVIQQTGRKLSLETGGLSGSPLRARSTEVIKRLYKNTGSNLPIIGVGGIDCPEAAWEKITAGASLLQIYTGWIFQGPHLVPRILEGLSHQLNKNGLNNVSEAVGTGIPWN
ncbi:quinone-dependent dihydroorotate dehydrogenase [Prochlorococcus sp. MIT 1300]|uniref:quinone-dependent dihydroorotate dehydrogenase n=1 Tax=Prochlorococcus sp. MIT 1300 TaxID=3096218 RepID=UPI002A7505D9|nr:quinone-dependent dihydroorotate dehydrogenase [Prochlorococcus sp. MIT 1300]